MENAETKKSPSGKVGTCGNCGRSKFIAGSNGFCGTCHNAVKSLSKNTPEYSAALAEIKKRVLDPDYGPGGRNDKKPEEKFKKKFTQILHQKTVLPVDCDVFKSARLTILESVIKERDSVMAYVGKLDRCIEILQI